MPAAAVTLNLIEASAPAHTLQVGRARFLRQGMGNHAPRNHPHHGNRLKLQRRERRGGERKVPEA